MLLRRFWPVAILIVAVLVYFWLDEDEPVPGKKPHQEPFVETPSQAIAPFPTPQPPLMPEDQTHYQAPAAAPGSRPFGFTYSEQNGRYQAPLSGQYRFRPEDEKEGKTRRPADFYARSRQDLRYPTPAPGWPDIPRTGIGPAPDETTTYRFRPRDEKRQSRRWEGNYARKPVPGYQPPGPYPYENYPSPLNQVGPAADRHRLWADSWPESD